ncbi:MAG TPA: hypothetical protein VFZ53_26645 [Polyangiaceae bacterium]
MVRSVLGCMVIALAITWSAPCAAEDTSAPDSGVAPASDALPVTIKLVSTPIQAEAIRGAIENELRVPVRVDDVPSDESLAVTVKWRRATVSYRSKQGEATTRSLDLPGNAAQAVEVIALLAGNLARDEASELLARLAPPPAPEPEPAPPDAQTATETPPPPESPAPVEAETKPEPAPKVAAKQAAAPPKGGLIRGNPTALNLTLWHPLTLLEKTERRALGGELGLAYSRVGAIEGVGFTGGYLRVEQDVRGAIGSFGLTRVDGDIIGFQWAGLFTEGHGKLRGAEIANFASLRWGNVEGAQAGGLFSLAKNVTGGQLSAGAAFADDILGGQIALVAVARDVRGGQINLVGVTRDLEGGQLVLVNVARDVDGGQLGLVNVARQVDVQLGLVNVAERVDGAALGLASIAGNGYVQPTVYTLLADTDSFNAGMKFVAGFTYSLLSAGMARDANGESHLRAEGGGGLHWEPLAFRNAPVVDRVALELGGHVSHTWLPAGEQDFLHYRGTVNLRTFGLLWLSVGYDVSHDLSPFGESFAKAPYFGLSLF